MYGCSRLTKGESTGPPPAIGCISVRTARRIAEKPGCLPKPVATFSDDPTSDGEQVVRCTPVTFSGTLAL
jgi:hypothetical protein